MVWVICGGSRQTRPTPVRFLLAEINSVATQPSSETSKGLSRLTRIRIGYVRVQVSIVGHVWRLLGQPRVIQDTLEDPARATRD